MFEGRSRRPGSRAPAPPAEVRKEFARIKAEAFAWWLRKDGRVHRHLGDRRAPGRVAERRQGGVGERGKRSSCEGRARRGQLPEVSKHVGSPRAGGGSGGWRGLARA